MVLCCEMLYAYIYLSTVKRALTTCGSVCGMVDIFRVVHHYCSSTRMAIAVLLKYLQVLLQC